MSPRFYYFDLGNVLLPFDRSVGFGRIAAAAGVTAEAVSAALLDSGLLWKHERNEVDETEFHRAFVETTGANLDKKEFLSLHADIFQMNHRLAPMVGCLAAARYPLGILSNLCESHWRHCSGRYTFLRLFETHIFSFRVGAMKPDERIYAAATEAAGVAPGEIFFTDDLPDNVAGAKAAGWDAVLYTSVEQLVEELTERGVKFNY